VTDRVRSDQQCEPEAERDREHAAALGATDADDRRAGPTEHQDRRPDRLGGDDVRRAPLLRRRRVGVHRVRRVTHRPASLGSPER
jgi:hypothetical protein